jgi:hypothetical protein
VGNFLKANSGAETFLTLSNKLKEKLLWEEEEEKNFGREERKASILNEECQLVVSMKKICDKNNS